MKRFAIYSLAAAAGMISTTAFAKSISFDFRVHSYGAALYPCDAGIQHVQSGGQKGDWMSVRKATLSPTAPITTPDTPSSALTWSTNPILSRILLSDMMYTAADQTGFATGLVTNKFKTRLWDMGNNGSATSDPDDVDDAGLHFFLTSNNYGAEYFVDLCYVGPNIPTAFAIPTSLGAPDYSVTASVTHVDLNPAPPASGENYLANADVDGQFTAACDTAGLWNVPGISDNFTSGFLGLTPVPTAAPTLATGFVPIATSGTPLYTGSLDLNAFAKHCVFRYIFKETSLNERSFIDGEHAQFRIFLDVKPTW